ncbi:hypothetical protein UPYG_G00346840 [Umbra pygmaea]|uniref:EF-hand domain-containing protein n=1 Tax=Umbra pygmaea TaxID=75934 RepID=A0ABD0VXS5_UMBPY
MKACPADLRPPHFLSCNPRLRPVRQGQTQQRQSLRAPKTHAGAVSRSLQYCDTTRGRRSAVVVPCVPVPVSLCPSRAAPALPVCPGPTPPTLTESSPQGTSPHPTPDPTQVYTKEEEKGTKDDAEELAKGPSVLSVTLCASGLDQGTNLGPEDMGPSASPVPSVSDGSLSDFSRPPSSQFSRSTDLSSGRSSGLPENLNDLEYPLSQLVSSSMTLSTRAPCTPPDSPMPHPPNPAMNNPLPNPHPTQTQHCLSDRSTSEPQPGHVLPLYPDPSLVPSLSPATPSDPWQSCPSPEFRRTPEPGPGSGLCSGFSLAPPLAERQEWTSHRWSVLPPISSGRGSSATMASPSRCSQVSSSQSHVFDELESITPRSGSSQSLDQPVSSADCRPSGTEMSPGLAALTLAGDLGNLGSMSRVQLLLLDRPDPVNPRCISGILQPVTAGSCGNCSVSERCVAIGQVCALGEDAMETPSDNSRSPWSRVSDSISSDNTSRSSATSCPSSYDEEVSGSRTSHTPTTLNDRHMGPGPKKGALEMEEPGCAGGVERGGASAAGRRRPGRTERRMRQKERKRDERKTKVLNIYSKLQDSGSFQPIINRGPSNFEDFNFLAKYCIFSQEKLTEYKRAFEAVDSDKDGYISCLQVLLALKKIIPPELLSDEEEIYVYRILEMVDFRVTDGLTDLRLFAVIASLAQKIATMDVFMRSLISKMDFRSLELKLYKAKQLFLFLLEEQAGGPGAQQGCIRAEQLLVELKAGGIHPEQEESIKQELQHISSLDLLDFLAYLPLFLLIHNSVITNPLDDSSNL